jgi:hypothetical protein
MTETPAVLRIRMNTDRTAKGYSTGMTTEGYDVPFPELLKMHKANFAELCKAFPRQDSEVAT